MNARLELVQGGGWLEKNNDHREFLIITKYVLYYYLYFLSIEIVKNIILPDVEFGTTFLCSVVNRNAYDYAIIVAIVTGIKK
jgi:hypothetical protein